MSNQNPAVDPATGKVVPSDPAGGTGAVTFTPEQQKAIDAIIGSRAAAAKASGATEGQEALLKALGFEKPEQLQTALAEYKKVTDAQKTEQQKLVDRNTALEAAATAADTKTKAAEARASEKLLRAAVLSEVVAAGIAKVEHESVWLLIKNDAALRDAIKPKGDDGFEGVDAVVKKIAEAHPLWVQPESQGDGVGTTRPASRKTRADPDADKAQQEASRQSYRARW